MSGDVIYALATARAPAALAVLRASGPSAWRVLEAMTCRPAPEPRRATLMRLFDPASGEALDEVVVTVFADGASYTGEESFELSCHGGLAVVDAIGAALERVGARMARPGEFTRRALLNGRLDLAQAEAVAALAAAETEQERRQSLAGLTGAVGVAAEAWREQLVELIGLLETSVDFVEENFGAEIEAGCAARVSALIAELKRHALDEAAVAAAEKPFTVALIGPPNAGKSSLLNALVERDAAIVSARPGTTRDVVGACLVIAGRRVEILDTAGQRLTEDDIEAEGVRRAEDAASAADAVALLVSADTLAAFRMTPSLVKALAVVNKVFWSKADLSPEPDPWLRERRGDVEALSLTTGEAAAVARRWLATQIEQNAAPLTAISSAPRRRALIRSALASLDDAQRALASGWPECTIAHVRRAATALGGLAAPIDQEEVLDGVFRRFCIGK